MKKLSKPAKLSLNSVGKRRGKAFFTEGNF